MKTTIRKSVGAAIGAGGFALGTALLDGAVTAPELLASLGAAVVTGAAVWKLKYQVPEQPGD